MVYAKLDGTYNRKLAGVTRLPSVLRKIQRVLRCLYNILTTFVRISREELYVSHGIVLCEVDCVGTIATLYRVVDHHDLITFS